MPADYPSESDWCLLIAKCQLLVAKNQVIDCDPVLRSGLQKNAALRFHNIPNSGNQLSLIC